MNHSFWLIVIFVAGFAESRPRGASDEWKTASSPTDVQTTTKVDSSTRGKPDIDAIAIVARASSDRPTFPATPSAVEGLEEVIGQMVDSDIRTPPKLKEIMQGKIGSEARRTQQQQTTEGHVADRIEANGRFELPDASERASSLPYAVKRKGEDVGVKGIAVPVLMDDDAETEAPKKLEKIADVKPVKDDRKKGAVKPLRDNPTTTPASGLSTWILLSDNRESSTTPTPKKNNKKEGSRPEERRPQQTPSSTTARKPVKAQATTPKPPKDQKTEASKTTAVVKKATPRPETRKPEESESISALEAMVKNQKKNPTSRPAEDAATKGSPVKKPATEAKNKPTRINDRMDAAETKEKSETAVTDVRKPVTIPPALPIATHNPTTVAVAETQSEGQSTTDPTVETTTKKKKTGSKKKKKNKNRRRKPSGGNETEIEQKNVSKNPKQPPVGAQLYNFLSREIMPTVGLGLVGVLVTAGLAGLLGYNPFVSGNLPVRRTYEVQHGYSPNTYYNSYNTDYSDGGQSEEVLFREVLSGMPEGSRYGLTNTENSYPESQIYNSQDQVYDAMKGHGDKKYQKGDSYSYPEKKEGTYEEDAPTYTQDYTASYASTYESPEVLKTRDNSDKYPIYNREVGASYVYPETATPEKSSRLDDEYARTDADKLSSRYNAKKGETIERQPEALYRVAGEYEHPYRGESTIQGISSQNSWHRIGSALDYQRFSHLEPGPRSLNFTKEEMLAPKKRTKRNAESVIQRIARKQTSGSAEKDVDNEIDFDDKKRRSTERTEVAETTTMATTTTTTTTEDTKSEDLTTTEADYDVIETNPIATYNFLDILKRVAQLKLKIGLSFLKSTTDAFSRYLDVMEKRVDESISNTTLVYRIRRDSSGSEPPSTRTGRSRRSLPDKANKRNKKNKEDARKKGKKATWKKH